MPVQVAHPDDGLHLNLPNGQTKNFVVPRGVKVEVDNDNHCVRIFRGDDCHTIKLTGTAEELDSMSNRLVTELMLLIG